MPKIKRSPMAMSPVHANAAAIDIAPTNSVANTVALRGANRPKLANRTVSQNTRISRNGIGIALPSSATRCQRVRVRSAAIWISSYATGYVVPLAGYTAAAAKLRDLTSLVAMQPLQAAGLTAMPGTLVASPWIKGAPASFECRRHVTLELGKSRQIILGEIVFAHYHHDIIDVERMRIDPAKLDAIARLGGDTCATIRDRFEMSTPKLAEFES